MEVIVAKSAGFCFGVKRAVEQVYKQIEEGVKPIYTYGPIIHNEEVVRELEEKGVAITVMKTLAMGTLLSRERSPLGVALTEAQCISYALSRPAVMI